MSMPPATPQAGPTDQLGTGPERVALGRAVRWALRQFARNGPPLVATALVAVPAQVVLGLLSARSGNGIASFGLNVLSSMAWAVFSLPLVRASLMIADGRRVRMGEVFTVAGAGRFVAPALVFGALTGIGLGLCVLPGAAAYAFLFMTPFLVVERQRGLDALGASLLLAKRHPLPSLGLGLFWIVATVIGLLMVGVGLLVSTPVTALASVHLHRQIVGQPIAR